MKASTLFALTLAILIGLGVAIAVKVSGLFDPKAPAPVAKKEAVKVLVASTNLFSGDLIQSKGVYLRDLKPSELEHYQQNKDQYLPPMVTAVNLRIAKNNIYADQPILKTDLENLLKPQSLPDRLVPSMRAVSLSVSKDKSAGGIIQLGEWVDVLLTSTVVDSNGNSTNRTATVAPRVRVIAKRNSLWPIFAALPEEKPIQFTLEMNPYRASLLEFVKAKGDLTLVPLPANEQRELEELRSVLMKQNGPIKQVHFLKSGTPEAERENALVSQYNRGELVVEERDLISLFGLTTSAPPESSVVIEQMVGTYHFNPAVFSNSGKRILPTKGQSAATTQNAGTPLPSIGFQFVAPSETTVKCKNCEKNQK